MFELEEMPSHAKFAFCVADTIWFIGIIKIHIGVLFSSQVYNWHLASSVHSLLKLKDEPITSSLQISMYNMFIKSIILHFATIVHASLSNFFNILLMCSYLSRLLFWHHNHHHHQQQQQQQKHSINLTLIAEFRYAGINAALAQQWWGRQRRNTDLFHYSSDCIFIHIL